MSDFSDKEFFQNDKNYLRFNQDLLWKSIGPTRGLIIPNVFDPKNPATDMTKMPKTCIVAYAQAADDFNEQLQGEKPPSRGGSARVQGQDNAHGIVTGHIKGWQSLKDTYQLFDDEVVSAKQLIDLNIAWLERKILKGNYTCIVYPADDNGMWASGILTVDADVKKYITFKLYGLMCNDDVVSKLRNPFVTEKPLSDRYAHACPYK